MRLNRAPAARDIPRTGDDSPAATVWGYVRRMTGWHQFGAGALALATAALAFAPVELQRRIVDDAIVPGDARLLLWLAAAYGVTLLLGQIAKATLAFYQGWLAESAARYTRSHLLRLHCAHRRGNEGEAVEVIVQEVDKLAGFAGEGPSTVIQHTGLLIVGIGYMLWVDAAVAAIGLALLLPQALITPVLQRRLNRLMRQRIRLMRVLGDRVGGQSLCAPKAGGAMLGRIYVNRMAIHVWKALTKAGLNLLNGLAPLSVLLVGGGLVIEGDTTVGIVLAFVSGFNRLGEPMRALIGFYRRCAQAEVQHDMIAHWM